MPLYVRKVATRRRGCSNKIERRFYVGSDYIGGGQACDGQPFIAYHGDAQCRPAHHLQDSRMGTAGNNYQSLVCDQDKCLLDDMPPYLPSGVDTLGYLLRLVNFHVGMSLPAP
jgi:hypothetical protein